MADNKDIYYPLFARATTTAEADKGFLFNKIMKKLPLELRKNGSIYTQLDRTENKAIYSQNMLNQTIGYEVFVIKKHDGYKIGNSIIEPSEIFPSNEEFGQSAWAFSRRSMAVEKYNSL